MPNKFNNPNKGGPQYSTAKGGPPSPSIPMKTGPFKGNIGKAGPNRAAGYTKIKQHTQDSGL